MVYMLFCYSVLHIFSLPRENSLTIFTCENVFELQSLLHYQAYCTGKYSNSIYKQGVIFNSHKSGQQDVHAMPFLAGFWFKILTIGSHFFLVHIWLSTRKINSYLVSLMMRENVNEFLCWKHLPGVGIREIINTLAQLWKPHGTSSWTPAAQTQWQSQLEGHRATSPAPNPAPCQAAAGQSRGSVLSPTTAHLAAHAQL